MNEKLRENLKKYWFWPKFSNLFPLLPLLNWLKSAVQPGNGRCTRNLSISADVFPRKMRKTRPLRTRTRQWKIMNVFFSVLSLVGVGVVVSRWHDSREARSRGGAGFAVEFFPRKDEKCLLWCDSWHSYGFLVGFPCFWIVWIAWRN